jgi:copper chaperone CopZ
METVTFNVDGIQNNTEKTQIKNAISKINGVNKINVDLDNNQIVVGYDMTSVSSSEIHYCIEGTGHHITTESYGELDKRNGEVYRSQK